LKKPLLFGLGAVLIILASVYLYLGGLNKIEVSVQSTPPAHRLIGKDFTGRDKDKQIGELFKEYRQYLVEGSLKGNLAMVYFKDVELKKNEVKMFVGVLLDELPTDFPDDSRILGLEFKQVVEAKLEVHNMVMPSPKAIEQRLHDKAKANRMLPLNYHLELYLPDNTVKVWLPVQ
jgi:hypothetical protein